MALEEDLEKKKNMLEDCREFLQIKFRTLDPGSHIQSLKTFWEMPHGPEMLSAWFEWVTTDGSRDGCLRVTIEENFESVFKMIQSFLSDIKGEVWDHKFEEVCNNAQANNGNEVMIKIFLLIDLLNLANHR